MNAPIEAYASTNEANSGSFIGSHRSPSTKYMAPALEDSSSSTPSQSNTAQMATTTRNPERNRIGRPRFRGCSNIREYDLLGKLGEGTFGEVYKGQSRKGGDIVALKKILVHNEKDGFPITALREIKILKMLSHVNVLKLQEMAIERSKAEGKKKAIMYMVTPYMDHDLAGLLENPNVKFTVPQIKCYMMQLLQGVRYLHGRRILHRDMKAANLLINNKGLLQIADFGLARPYEGTLPRPGHGNGEAAREYTSLVVTRWYRPPELLLQLRRYTPAIDMWGVGCVFGEMFVGRPIMAGTSDVNQIQMIFDLVGSPTVQTMPGWATLPGCDGVREFRPRPSTLAQRFREQGSTAISLLSQLLQLNWRTRINAMDALNHPYFSEDPQPARPGDLPRYEPSHELDRRRFRSQRANLPPAPPGGNVGRAPPPPPPPPPRAGNGDGNGYRRDHDWRGGYSNAGRGDHYRSGPDGRAPNLLPGQSHGPIRQPAWANPQDARLPPRPNLGGRAPEAGAVGGRGRGPPRTGREARGDTYVPTYTDDAHRRGWGPPAGSDWPGRGRGRNSPDDRDRDRDRDWRKDERRRSRSRSPKNDRERDKAREARERDWNLYRR